MGPAEAKVNLQRLVGKFTLLFALIYVQLLIAAVALSFNGDSPAPVVWLMLLIPAVVFVPAVVDAVNLHRTRDQQRLSRLWRRCGLLGVSGIGLIMVAALVLGEAGR